MEFAVRPAVAADVASMQAIRSSVLQNRLADPERIDESSYAPYLASGGAWVAETESAIVGFAAIDAAAGAVWALFIASAAEGAGVGRALHERMLDWAREQGMTRLHLSTEAGTRAADFYRRAGWQETGKNADSELVFELALA